MTALRFPFDIRFLKGSSPGLSAPAFGPKGGPSPTKALVNIVGIPSTTSFLKTDFPVSCIFENLPSGAVSLGAFPSCLRDNPAMDNALSIAALATAPPSLLILLIRTSFLPRFLGVPPVASNTPKPKAPVISPTTRGALGEVASGDFVLDFFFVDLLP